VCRSTSQLQTAIFVKNVLDLNKQIAVHFETMLSFVKSGGSDAAMAAYAAATMSCGLQLDRQPYMCIRSSICMICSEPIGYASREPEGLNKIGSEPL
jgi:hypothetical protein